MQLLPKLRCAYLFEHATGDHSKQFRPSLEVVQNYRFQFEIVIGENGLLSKFYLSFLSRKNKPIKSKENSKK